MIERLSITVGSDELVFEVGRIAKQAQGAVLVVCGETMVLSAACASPDTRPGQDFFPLTIDYREKSASAGRIPGNFFRREGRPTEREILVCRLTDRPLRPLFPKGFINETQVCSTVYSADNIHNPDIMSINGASASLHISAIPFNGPVGAVRVGLIDGQLVVNPDMAGMKDSAIDLVIAGTKDAITMVEGGALELSEDKVIEALEFGHEHIRQICAGIEELRSRVGVEKMTLEPCAIPAEVTADVEKLAADRLRELLAVAEKQARETGIHDLKTEIREKLAETYGEELSAERDPHVKEAFEDLLKNVMRNQILADGVRVDGRKSDEIRPITIEVGVLPRAHGSCLFTRGETQALVSTTLGTSRDEQRLDELTGEEFKRFMLHYNFPPWSVGEVRRIMGPGRREIGHGRLAERALENMLPFEAEELTDPTEDIAFPYTVRVVSDITESNGSSSMASVCGATMSLMDAGVPLEGPVAGIAMGLVKEGEQACILSDILGAEDHLGDMDFKVCGTRKGITSFQMDIKIAGITSALMKQALDQAKAGRLHILDAMEACLAAPRSDVSQYAPRIYTIKIDPEKIRDVIGRGGSVIREIQKETEADISVEDDGTVHVAAVDKESADRAIEIITSLTAEPEVGKVYTGQVSRIMGFGAFVSFMGNKEGLVHISELALGHVREVTDEVNVGDEISVKVIEIDSMGRVNLSKVQADRELGLISEEEIRRHEEQKRNDQRRKPDRGPRGRSDRGRSDRGRGGGRPRGGGRSR